MASTTIEEKYIAVSPYGTYAGAFGVGATIKEAKDNCKKHGGNLNKVIVYELPEGATDVYVNNFGTVQWTWADGYPADLNSSGPVNLTVAYKRGVDLT